MVRAISRPSHAGAGRCGNCTADGWEGLIAGALTQTGNIGITSAFPNVQVSRRQAGFILGVQDAAALLNKEINVYVKFAGDWYLPVDEKAIAETLVDTYDVDVLTQQTDSSSTMDMAKEKGVWFVGKDMDIVGEYGWSDTDTVAVSFDTRWEVIYEQMVLDYLAGNKTPDTILYPGMETTMTLADGPVEPTVDLMNDGKIGIDAISPAALPSIPQEIIDLVVLRREQMMTGEWDPFTEHEIREQRNGPGARRPANPGSGHRGPGRRRGRQDEQPSHELVHSARRSAMAFASIDILILPGPERSLDQASGSPDGWDGGRVRSRNVASRTAMDRAYSSNEMCSRAVWSRDESPGP